MILTIRPFRFLWMDTDENELTKDFPFSDWEDIPIEELKLPAEIYRLADYVPANENVPDFLKWFDSNQFNTSRNRESLNLVEGSRGDRTLARLALFRWLDQTTEPIDIFKAKCEELAEMPASDGTRQIVVFASGDGGIGSGWFLDIGRLLRRTNQFLQHQNPSVVKLVPDIFGILCNSPDKSRPENRLALEIEMETAHMAGMYPQTLSYSNNEVDILREKDTVSPYDRIFSVNESDLNSVAGQCADSGSILANRLPRRKLIEQITNLDSDIYSGIGSRSLHMLTTEMREQVFYNLFLRTIGPEILLDIEPDDRGEYRSIQIEPEHTINKLTGWKTSLQETNPLKLFVASTVDSSQIDTLIDSVAKMPSLNSEWLTRAFALSVNENLKGFKDSETGGWQRRWMPAKLSKLLNYLKPDLNQRLFLN